jgi:hypothetical protein
LSGCGSDSSGGASDQYGIPDDVDLSAPCPANGTWLSNTPVKAAKTPDAEFNYFPTRLDGRLFLENWRFDIELMAWRNTGVCAYIYYLYACDFESYYSGESMYGYIDPKSATTDTNGRTVYTGYTTNGLTFIFSDQDYPAKLYIKIDPDEDGEFHEQFFMPEP